MRKHTRRRLLGGLVVSLAMVATTTGGGQAALAANAAQASAPVPPPLRPTLPKPTGPYAIGATELHLVDRERPDPWLPDRSRGLMVSVWYPARPGGDRPLMPYLPAGAATLFGQYMDNTLALAPGQVDWAGIKTHARAGAPVLDRRGGYPVVLFSPGAGLPRYGPHLRNTRGRVPRWSGRGGEQTLVVYHLPSA